MKLTVLLENTAANPSVITEHGLSLFLERDDGNLLFDMGQTDAFVHNARLSGADLTSVKAAVLSHGHYDHGGGLKTFLERNNTAPIYLSTHAFEPHYSTKYIGLDPSLMGHARLHFVTEITEILPGVTLFPAIPCRYPLQPFGLTAERNGVRTSDDFRHEQYMMVKEGDRKILFSGCSHRGILNIAEYFREVWGVDTIIGGFHYSKLDPAGDGMNDLETAAEKLLKTGVTFYTCHCTGEAQSRFLQEKMGGQLHVLRCGNTIEWV